MDGPFVRADEIQHQPDGGRLAGTVGTNQAKGLAPFERKRDVHKGRRHWPEEFFTVTLSDAVENYHAVILYFSEDKVKKEGTANGGAFFELGGVDYLTTQGAPAAAKLSTA